MSILDTAGVLLLLCALPIHIIASYLLVIIAAAWWAHCRRSPPAFPQNTQGSLAVVIPAHNEVLSIQSTVKVVLADIRPQAEVANGAASDMVFVIADNCDDATAELAKAAGATVCERHDDTLRGKGYALDWFFTTHASLLADNGITGVVVIDADTRMERGFLTTMRQSLTQYDAVQGFYGVANPDAGRRAALMAAALSVVHYVRPLGRTTLGGVAGLKGNGMGFSLDLLRRIGWPEHGLAEDLDFSNVLLLEGIAIAFVPEARVWAEMTIREKDAAKQRARWEGGRLASIKRFGPRLWAAWCHSPRIALLDGLFDLITPPLALLVAAQAGILGASMSLRLLGATAYTPIHACSLVISASMVFSGLIMTRAPLIVWKSLCSAPIFLLWKLLITLTLVRGGAPTSWERTTRVKETTPSSHKEPRP